MKLIDTGKRAVATLSALAQETRLAIFRLLVQAGPGGLPAGEIADGLEIPSATLSFHLTRLSRAGLIDGRRDGRSIIYSADYATMQALVGYLTQNCCVGARAATRKPKAAMTRGHST